MVAPASHHDGTMTPALLEDGPPVWIVGDNAFHTPAAEEWLLQQRQIARIARSRRTAGQAWPAPVRHQLNNVRRTIVSALSVLCTVFHVEQLGSRSLAGLLSRVTTRLLAYTLSFIVWAFLPALKN
jgi:hypothetical protein